MVDLRSCSRGCSKFKGGGETIHRKCWNVEGIEGQSSVLSTMCSEES